MRNRRFGVELEFDSNGLGVEGVGDLLSSNGIGEAWTGQKESYETYYGEYHHTYSAIGEDGSEIELRSPILEGERGFKELRKVVSLLNNAGCYTTEEDGLHVHHDAPDYRHDKDLVVKLLKSWKNNEHHIAMFVDEARASESLYLDEWGGNSPCPTFPYSNIYNVEQIQEPDFTNGLYRAGFSVRNNLNINALRRHGSIEFRMHEGTLYWDQIEAWIRFGQSFLNSVKSRKNPVTSVDNPVILMNRLKTNKRARVQLARTAGMAHLV